MDDKINKQEREHRQMTTEQKDAHLLVSVSEAPSRIENFNIPSTSTGRTGALAVNSPSGLVLADDSNPNGSSKPLPNQKRDRKGNYALVETSEEADLGRDPRIKDKAGMEGMSAVPKPSGMDMASTPEMSPSRDARPLE
eukprot:1180602-Pleurochrysis_carterae.AAC.2